VRQSIALIVLSVALAAPWAFAGGGPGYDRALFPHWTDPDGDGMTAREQALRRTSLRPVVVSHDGRVVSGLWLDPYTCRVITDPGKLDVDHVVPLRWAWDHGADQWDGERRAALANDQGNLAVVSAQANRAKGAAGPDEWTPPHEPLQAEYRRWFGEVCRAYELEDCPQ